MANEEEEENLFYQGINLYKKSIYRAAIYIWLAIGCHVT